MSVAELYDNGCLNTAKLREHLRQEGRLTEECALKVIQDGKEPKLEISRGNYSQKNEAGHQ